jgi:glucosamine-6-phosphate deaminase
MFVTVTGSYDEMSQRAALLVASHIVVNPDSVLGLPTGSTPVGMYRELIRMHREMRLDFSGVTTFNLDEYAGLGPSDPQSYHHFMKETFWSQVNLRRSRAFVPNGLAKDLQTECGRYEKLIERRGPIDLFVLGIGQNGHIGFNEPSRALLAETHMEKLSEKTRRDNARFFRSLSEVPRYAITMGMGTIMKAREIILLAGSKEKAEAVKRAVKGPVTPAVPASVLQLHPACRMIIDASAASGL